MYSNPPLGLKLTQWHSHANLLHNFIVNAKWDAALNSLGEDVGKTILLIYLENEYAASPETFLEQLTMKTMF